MSFQKISFFQKSVSAQNLATPLFLLFLTQFISDIFIQKHPIQSGRDRWHNSSFANRFNSISVISLKPCENKVVFTLNFFVENMEFTLQLFNGIIGIVFLYFGAEWLVKGSASLARKAGISPLVIGLTLVAFATSAPELVVSVSAAVDGSPGIALGNVVGSNICNIALILGLSACITPLEVKKQLFKSDGVVMCISAILLTVFYLCSKGLAVWQGMLFLAGIIAYTVHLIYTSRKENKLTQAEDSPQSSPGFLKSAALVIVGLAALIGGAKLLLWSAIYLARIMQISETVVGLTIVAVGTSLPELATSVVSAMKGEKDIAIGNVIGSNIFNILCILGVTPLISPLKNAKIDIVDLGTMILCSVLLMIQMRTGWKISRKEGFLLLLIYAAYTGYLIASHQ